MRTSQDIYYWLCIFCNGDYLWFSQSLLHQRVFTLVTTCCWTSKKVLSVGSLVISCLNHVILFTSCVTAVILFYFGVASNIVKTEKLEGMSLCSLTDQWKPHDKIPICSRDLGRLVFRPGSSFEPSNWPHLALKWLRSTWNQLIVNEVRRLTWLTYNQLLT